MKTKLTLFAFIATTLTACGPGVASTPTPSPSPSATPTAIADSTPTPAPTATATPDPGPPSRKKIFVSAATVSFPLGGSAAAAITAADSACASDANKPSGSATYKALIVNSSRVACTSANCATSGVNENTAWVLSPSTTYYRADGSTPIGTTTSAGIFTFPLTNAVSTSSVSMATGLVTDWTTGANCTDWTTGNVGTSFRTGYSAGTSAAAIDMGAGSMTTCNQTAYLFCVEQ